MSKTASLGPVRDAHRFDESALERWMQAHVEGFEGPLSLEQFDSGQSNPTFCVTGGRRRYVVRKKPPGKLLPKAHMVEREFRVMRALEDSPVPVPRMLGLCEDPSVIGTPFFVMEFLKGRVFFDATFPASSSAERTALFDAMNRTLADLHAVDFEAAGLGDYGRRGSYFERQISVWSRQYQASETEGIGSMDALMAWLPAHVPADDVTTLAHGDFRLDNLIFHPERPEVIAVVDWELSTLGHPLADLAYSCIGWVMDTPYHACLAPLAGPETGIPTMEDYVAAYCERRGIPPVGDLSFHLAFSIFRTAAIVQGVYKRGLEGNASSTQALSLGPLVRRAGDAAWKLVS